MADGYFYESETKWGIWEIYFVLLVDGTFYERDSQGVKHDCPDKTTDIICYENPWSF